MSVHNRQEAPSAARNPPFSPPTWPPLTLGGRAGHFLGDISYGVFAYHVVVLGVVERLTGHVVFTGRFATLFWLTLSASVVLATLSYRLMERPIMRRGRRDRRFDVSPSPNDITDDLTRNAATPAKPKAKSVTH